MQWVARCDSRKRLSARCQKRNIVSTQPDHRGESGFSLIEIIVVLALIVFVYSVALPQFNLRTGAEVSVKLSQLAGDVRGAYDLAVLTGRPYRMVLQFNTGDYWLEETDRPDFEMAADKVDREPTEQEEKDEAAAFDTKFQEYTELAGPSVPDPKSSKEIPPASPLLQAKAALRKPTWTKVDGAEFSNRSIGPHLMIKDMQAEHQGHKLDLNELGPDAHGILYFFPSGYVERAVLHIAYKKSDMVIDETQEPYTVITNPFEGTADVLPGSRDIDVHEQRED